MGLACDHEISGEFIYLCSTQCQIQNRQVCWLSFYVARLKVKVAQLCLTQLSQGYTIHGILQARILEWVAVPFSREFPDPGIQ